jgi:WD40 repeat protein
MYNKFIVIIVINLLATYTCFGGGEAEKSTITPLKSLAMRALTQDLAQQISHGDETTIINQVDNLSSYSEPIANEIKDCLKSKLMNQYSTILTKYLYSVRSLAEGHGSVTASLLSPNNKYFLIGGNDGSVTVFKIEGPNSFNITGYTIYAFGCQ